MFSSQVLLVPDPCLFSLYSGTGSEENGACREGGEGKTLAGLKCR
jgi:hypothetical protein